jgi:predicted metal-dependent hydrolase
MPKEYADQIERAFERLTKTKYDIVEDLARRYEEMGRQKVADKVRKAGLSWFDKEPAEIRTAAEYADLDLTYDDVIIYREYRAKFMNSSKVITQDVISDLIEVVIDPEAGVYEKLKDKTRAEAIADVKQTYKAWAKDNPVDSDLATKVIWKDVNSLKV